MFFAERNSDMKLVNFFSSNIEKNRNKSNKEYIGFFLSNTQKICLKGKI